MSIFCNPCYPQDMNNQLNEAFKWLYIVDFTERKLSELNMPQYLTKFSKTNNMLKTEYQ